jgi:DNA-directed RNA polymerase subunit F
MTIKHNESLSMAEVSEYVEKGSDIAKFIKKFVKLSYEKAKELRAELEKLDIMKMKSEQISKVIDFLPENQEDLNKIFIGASLDEDESKRILDAVKQYI